MFYERTFVRRLKRPGRHYQGVLCYKDEDGTWKQKTHALEAQTKGAAQVELSSWREQEERVHSIIEQHSVDPNCTVADYVDRFVDELERARSVEPSTVCGYRGSAKFVREAFGEIRLTDLSPMMVKDWEMSLTERGLSSSTVGKAHRLLKQSLNEAVDLEVLDRNPVNPVKPPKRKPQKAGINALDAQGCRKLLDQLESMEMTPVSVSAQIALYTGLREAEVCGLQWRDFSAKDGTLWVRRSIGLAKGGAYIKTPKTDKVRDVAVSASLKRLLRVWRFAQQEMFDEHGVEVDSQTYIVGDEDGFLHPSVLSRGWYQLASLLGVRGCEGRQITYHDLRHTWATVYLASSGDVKTAASNLGHANAAMTLNVYASVDPEAKRSAGELIERVMRGA